MLIADRYERIVELVNERGSIRVSELRDRKSTRLNSSHWE